MVSEFELCILLGTDAGLLQPLPRYSRQRPPQFLSQLRDDLRMQVLHCPVCCIRLDARRQASRFQASETAWAAAASAAGGGRGYTALSLNASSSCLCICAVSPVMVVLWISFASWSNECHRHLGWHEPCLVSAFSHLLPASAAPGREA